jgi:hypothetical protein
MLNNTNTCLYQACTKITTYHHKICVLTKFQPVPFINHASTCTSTYTINHITQPVPQQVHQPCTNTCTKLCINHAPQPIPNCASTMHLNTIPCANHAHQPCTISCIIPCPNYAHQPCTSIMYINTIPCTNPVPYHVSNMHHNKCLNHIPYHAIHHMPKNQDMNPQYISSSRLQHVTCIQ